MLSSEDQAFLFSTARQSIEYGLSFRKALLPSVRELANHLTAIRATFVTLKLKQDLRGCIGTTRAIEPLIVSVANNAFSAAFHDPRFDPLNKTEFPHIRLGISVLTEPEPIDFTAESDLVAQLVAGVDGLIIEKEERKATFLPSVWETLQNPEDFLFHLKHKACLAHGQTIEKAWRYRSEYYEE